MDQIQKRLNKLTEDIGVAFKKLEIDERSKELENLRDQMSNSDFWHDRVKAEQVSRKEASVAKQIRPWLDLRDQLNDISELSRLNDPTIKKEIDQHLAKAEKEYENLKKELQFRGPFDDHDAILSLHAGAGGTDAQDWTQMLLRMYTRWAEAHDINMIAIDQTPGEEAGLKSATIRLSGNSFLYGKLAGEHGVHRLVRLSPFNADHLRQTSFAKVEVMPAIDQPTELEIDDKDLKIDVFRAGGHGGQSVNTTDSAVRVTHLPTGISVSVQNERSQLQNKETAMAILRSKLVQLQQEQHAKNLSDIKGPNQSAEWGNQIRSYVLHPYKQVKDLRTGYETSNAEKVLDGDLDPFINAWLEQGQAS